MSLTEGGDTLRKRPGPKTGAEQVAMGILNNTKYRPEFCEKVVEWGKLGKSPAWMASRMDTTKQSLFDWAKMHTQFAAALTLAMTHAQAFWEDEGEVGMKQQGFNAAIWARNMASRFRDDWTETKHVTNEDGPNKAAAATEDRARGLELIERLGLALPQGGAGKPAQAEGAGEFPGLREVNRRSGRAS